MSQWATLSVEDRIALIKSKWDDGVSARDLASRIGGVSRNAIIGMYSRHGSKLSDTPLQVPPGSPGRKAKAPRVPKVRKVAARRPVVEREKPVPRVRVAATPIPEPTDIRRVPLIELERGECKWPVDHDGERHLFCGLARRDRDTSYCAHHAHRSHYAEELS